jgi:hypothetical protein
MLGVADGRMPIPALRLDSRLAKDLRIGTA